MKFLTIATLISTTQAAAGAAWSTKDATDGCAAETYVCGVSACETPANNVDVCIPSNVSFAANALIKDSSTPPPASNPYLTDETCKAT